MPRPASAASDDRDSDGATERGRPPASVSRVETLGAYETRRSDHQDFVAWVKNYIEEELQSFGIDVAWVEGRAKALASYALKLLYGPNFRTTELEDFAALRVITYFDADKVAVAERLADLLGPDNCESDSPHERVSQLEPWEFAYRTRHLRCRIPERLEPNPKSMANRWFELQVRTISEHAWASVDHKLRYKSTTPLSHSQARTLFRAAALLENIDTDFSNLHDAATRNLTNDGQRVLKGKYGTSVTPETARILMSTDTDVVRAFLVAADNGWVFTNPTPAVYDEGPDERDEFAWALVDLEELCDALSVDTIQSLKDEIVETLQREDFMPALVRAFEGHGLALTGSVPDFVALLLSATHDLPAKKPYRLWSEALAYLQSAVAGPRSPQSHSRAEGEQKQ